jgi:uncharacterized membrane protein YqjE
MANDRDTPPKMEAGELLAGILTDVEMLIGQQMALFRHEIGEEVGQAREAGAYIVVGLVIVLTSTLLLSLMVVHLLALLIPGLPLWACFGIVGTPLTFLGGAVCLTGIRKLNRDDAATAGHSLDLEEKYDG